MLEFQINLLLLLLIVFVVSATLVVVILGRSLKHKRPMGITLIGIALIAGSLNELRAFFNSMYYAFMFRELPLMVLVARYLFSISLRVLGVVAGVGVLCLKNFARRLTLYISIFTLCTIYWKHPYSIFEHLAKYVDRQFASTSIIFPLSFSSHPLIVMIFFYTLDIAFALLCIIYFTRPNVRAYFQKREEKHL